MKDPERNRLLLGKLLTRGPQAYKNYVNALEQSGTDNHLRLLGILKNDVRGTVGPVLVDAKLQVR